MTSCSFIFRDFHDSECGAPTHRTRVFDLTHWTEAAVPHRERSALVCNKRGRGKTFVGAESEASQDCWPCELVVDGVDLWFADSQLKPDFLALNSIVLEDTGIGSTSTTSEPLDTEICVTTLEDTGIEVFGDASISEPLKTEIGETILDDTGIEVEGVVAGEASTCPFVAARDGLRNATESLSADVKPDFLALTSTVLEDTGTGSTSTTSEPLDTEICVTTLEDNGIEVLGDATISEPLKTEIGETTLDDTGTEVEGVVEGDASTCPFVAARDGLRNAAESLSADVKLAAISAAMAVLSSIDPAGIIEHSAEHHLVVAMHAAMREMSEIAANSENIVSS